ncbi:MAG: YcxB family protein [Lachnospiraceae bacterium]|nr:YcxB family protein [Lachnospiraceae bacterium]MDD6169404.1 YcxB family protein [Lachnospiraceae bacterium]
MTVKLELDVTLTDKDMYRFNMYHMYSGVHGIFSIVIAIMIFVVAGVTWGDVERGYSIAYVAFGVVFLIYMPCTLKLKSKQQLKMSASLREGLHYLFDEEGIHVSQGEETAELLWKQVYKMVATKSNVLIYSNRVNAFVIPRTQLGEKYQPLKELAEKQLEKFRIRMK